MMINTALDSYPPLFRPLNQDQTKQQANSTPATPDGRLTDPIPVIDLEGLDSGSLDEACMEWGVFHLVNHGIPAALLNEVRDHAGGVFGLPFETKQEKFKSPTSYFWGTPVLTPTGSAISSGPKSVNLVEGMNFPLSQLPLLEDSQLPLVESFREVLQEYGKHMGRIATSLFQAMAKILDLDADLWEGFLSEPTGFIRMYRYPCSSMFGLGEDSPGMVAHTDSSVVAILLQNDVSGLEVQRDGRWFLVNPIPGGLVVNLGDMMQALSNDGYKSVNHRVRAPREQSDRISICYFVFPGKGKVIKSSKYREFTYEEFQAQVQRDVKTIGGKVGLDRFKLDDVANQHQTQIGSSF